MKFALAVLFVLLGSPLYAADWAVVASKVKESIVEIAVGTQGACTGFVIDNVHDVVLTAAHCDNPTKSGEDLYVDLLPARVRLKDVKNDLMVLYVEGIDRPGLKLAKNDPGVGEEVASYGYGWALDKPLFRVAHISVGDLNIERARYLGVDSSFIPGQSGGPVFNINGEVVLIVQLGNATTGFGVGAEVIEDKVGRFFTKN